MQRKVYPNHFDLSDPVIDYLPQDLIQQWIASDRSNEMHEKLLAPYLRRGTIVSSDSAGLSALTQAKPLIEVLKLVSEPKEIIHAQGIAIGGEAIGTWVADNSLMFYSEEISPLEVTRQMVLAQKKIEKVAVSVGIGIHYGEVYHIGGGLYGEESKLIEEFTENESKGGDIIISPSTVKHLREPFDRLEAYQEMFRLQYDNLDAQGVDGDNIDYPAPFDAHFQDQIRQWDNNQPLILDEKHRPFVSTVALVFFYPSKELRLLDRFVQQLEVSQQTKEITAKHGVDLLKTNGLIGVFHSKDKEEVIACTKELHQIFSSRARTVNIGVSCGDIMLFSLEKGRDLAGEAVNFASKLAEDSEYRGAILFDQTVSEAAKKQGITEAFSLSVSRLVLEGVLRRG